MRVEYVPLLRRQREIYRVPRGLERFRTYLDSMLTEDRNDAEIPPLVVVNPMAREHVPAMLDVLLDLDADGEAARAVESVAADLAAEHEPLRASLVVADDARGGWINRWAIEFAMRLCALDRKRPWITGILWSSEAPSVRVARETILAALYRVDDQIRNGQATTLGDLMRREGEILARAGWSGPELDDEEAEYTREVVAPFLGELDVRVGVECLFGDQAARSLGFTPRGLSPWAGLSLAVRDARVGV